MPLTCRDLEIVDGAVGLVDGAVGVGVGVGIGIGDGDAAKGLACLDAGQRAAFQPEWIPRASCIGKRSRAASDSP